MFKRNKFSARTGEYWALPLTHPICVIIWRVIDNFLFLPLPSRSPLCRRRNPQSPADSECFIIASCRNIFTFPLNYFLERTYFLSTLYWHGHGGQGDSKPSQVRLWKRDKWGCWGWSYSSYTQNVCYNWLYKWHNLTRWHHKTYVSHFLKTIIQQMNIWEFGQP